MEFQWIRNLYNWTDILIKKMFVIKFDDYSFEIIGKILEIHKILGPGLLENTYQKCLYYELTNAVSFVENKKYCLWLIRN